MAGMRAPDVRLTCVASLFPRQHLPYDETPVLARDLQIWPRQMRETRQCQQLHRTAGVKHHLRSMANRDDMLTTYEHDFGHMTRPHAKGRSFSSRAGTGRHADAAGRDVPTVSAPASARMSMSARIAAPKPWEGRDDDQPHSARSSKVGSRDRDPYATLRPEMLNKMEAASPRDEPMRFTVNGWGDTKWCPKTHPWMASSMTGKRVSLAQTAQAMNLRAPDVPFSTR